MFAYMYRGKRMKLLIFIPQFWFKRLCRINNVKNDSKYNNTNMG